MNGFDAQGELQRLYRLLTSSEPRELRTHLSLVEFGRPMVPGTTVPALGATNFRPTSSGLLVPVSAIQDVAPIDLVKTFITPDEILGARLADEIAWAKLRATPPAVVLDFVATTLCRWRNPAFSSADNDRYFARAWFDEYVSNIVLGILQGNNRGLVAPQALLVLLKMAFLISWDAEGDDAPLDHLVIPLLAVMQNLGAHATDSNNPVLEDTPGPLGREIISNQLFNSSLEIAGVLARYVRRWTELPVEHAQDSRVVDITSVYRDITGVELWDLAIVGLAFIAGSWQGRVAFSLDYFSNLGWEESKLLRVLNLISCDMDVMRQGIISETETRGLQWAFSTFERYPVVRVRTSEYRLIDSMLMLRRVFGWLPVFDVTSRLAEADTRESRKMKGQFEACVRYLAEWYALEVVESIVRTGSHTRLYSEEQIKAAYGKKGVRIADCAIDYGDAWVILEITSSQLTRESVSGVSDEHVMADIDKLVGKVEQIDYTIRSIRGDERRLTGKPGVPNLRFFPVLVVTEGFPVNPVTLHLLRQKVSEAGYLAAADIAELEVLDTAELELIEAVHERHGISFRGVIDSKGRSNLRRVSVRDYIIVERGLSPEFSSRVNRLSDKVFRAVIEALAGISGEHSSEAE